ncbi:MAG: acyl-CoA thioester hydrolase/BAAT C-terminal domain-containing protein [Myxococcota bacterium]
MWKWRAIAALACAGAGACGVEPGSGGLDASAPAPDAQARGDAEVVDQGSLDAAAQDSGAQTSTTPTLRVFSRALSSDAWSEQSQPFFGDALDVRLSGFPPEAEVEVRSSSGPYRAAARFRVGREGEVDLAQAAPISGSYAGVDPDGLLWSMTSPGGPGDRVDFAIAFSAWVDDEMKAAVTLVRTYAPPHARLERVREQGLVGFYVAPEGEGPFPGLLIFGGSEGGLGTGQVLAQYYASLGYACLGLAYFDGPGLPSTLENVPLEYFGTALRWLKARPEVAPARLGVMGGSRGGELALLLGAHYPELKAVVATVPSGVVWGGISLTSTQPVAAWTWGGQPLPSVPYSGAEPEARADPQGNVAYGEAPVFLADLAAAAPEALERATIRVEDSQAAILMIAGDDDQLWASCTLAEIAWERLMRHGHGQTHADGYHCYPGAGHVITTPNLPTMDVAETYLPDFGYYLWLGGTPAAAAHAARSSDEEIRKFLRDNL